MCSRASAARSRPSATSSTSPEGRTSSTSSSSRRTVWSVSAPAGTRTRPWTSSKRSGRSCWAKTRSWGSTAGREAGHSMPGPGACTARTALTQSLRERAGEARQGRRVLAEEQRGLEQLELHPLRASVAVAHEVHAPVEQLAPEAREQPLGQGALVGVDRERARHALGLAREARGLADRVGQLAVDPHERALAARLDRGRIALHEDVALGEQRAQVGLALRELAAIGNAQRAEGGGRDGRLDHDVLPAALGEDLGQRGPRAAREEG